jgi:hypothetical protein
MAFLRREYTVLAVFVLVVGGLLWLAIGQWTAVAFFFGAFSSMTAGFIGMKAATKANVRTSEAARSQRAGAGAADGVQRRRGDGARGRLARPLRDRDHLLLRHPSAGRVHGPRS